ncbi:MAG: Chaperone protein HtpG [uncultured Thermomicrobiales bacterium]|uniref:Chaperone protein HtpG n=1 Tax=uncultured Thermomicrobiales bacterium TaxID=1645740 RepID=A0A6J4V1K4_9BACT|nr:MAG: Chaperone protein HtpG [uncultured Thermomicrobiales bacterium]
MTVNTGSTDQAEQTSVPFRAEVKQLLHILAHSLYSDREVFLRELISNASDALHRVQFEMLTNREVHDAGAELAIRVTADAEAKTVTVADSGIGMTREELVEHLGTIAQSGVKALMEGLESGQRGQLIGQFGVGFYAAFVVAEEITVVSRSYRPEAGAAQWRSRGDETFTVGPAERAERGTTITLKLREDAAEFADTWRLKHIVKRHSDFVAFPVYVDDEQANQQTALWRQPAHQVKDEAYAKFYHELTHDSDEPLRHVHVSTDVPLDLHAILFVPAKRERGLLERRIEGRIKLYSRKVLIREEAQDLLPAHFRFVEGVVDSEDLPLNVARETVQSSPALQRIKRTLSGRLTRALGELAEQEPDKYADFWREFGPFLKEGLVTDPSVRDDLLPLLRFHSTKAEDRLIGLTEYAGRLAEGQTEIYYVLAGDLDSARRSPHLEALEARGLEALLLTDVVDSFMLGALREYEGKALRNVDDPDLTLPGAAEDPTAQVDEETFARLATRAKGALGDRVTEVRGSTVLRSSPARLVSPDAGPGREMARLQRLLDRDDSVPPKLLELNRAHPLVVDLARLADERPDDPLFGLVVEQLYDNALLLEGLHPNPAAMVGRLQSLLEAAARGAR